MITIERAADMSVNGKDYKERALGEYWFVKNKYNRLRAMIVKREAGKLGFEPSCPMWQWEKQISAMGQYLYMLEVKAEMERIDLFDNLFEEE